MVQTKINGQRFNNNGNRFGGASSWRQHRDDGYDANVVRRTALTGRLARTEMLSEAHNAEFTGVSEPLVDFDATVVVFDCGSALEFVTPDGDTQVYLRYYRSGKLSSAHSGPADYEF